MIFQTLKAFHSDETGQGMTEYILIVVFIAVAVLVTLGTMKGHLKDLFNGTNSEIGSIDVTPTS